MNGVLLARSVSLFITFTYVTNFTFVSSLAQALTLFGEDDDYHMVVATCYIRLNKYDEALRLLQTVLDRSPNNYKALYHYAFCQRASGSQKNAIEGLTKVLMVLVVLSVELMCIVELIKSCNRCTAHHSRV